MKSNGPLLIAAFAACALSIPAFSQDFGETVSAAMDAFREVRTQSTAPENIKAIFAKASEAEDEGCINFGGFYLGMSEADARTLATYYGLKDNQWSFVATPETKRVYTMTFTLHGIRRVTKGGNTFDELSQAVVDRIGTMKSKRDDNYNLIGYENIKTLTTKRRSYLNKADLSAKMRNLPTRLKLNRRYGCARSKHNVKPRQKIGVKKWSWSCKQRRRQNLIRNFRPKMK